MHYVIIFKKYLNGSLRKSAQQGQEQQSWPAQEETDPTSSKGGQEEEKQGSGGRCQATQCYPHHKMQAQAAQAGED